MENIEKQLKLSKETGLGINTKVKFQEKSNFILSEDGEKCPYCNKYSDYSVISKEYETNYTIEKTLKEKKGAHWAHFWTVDCKCNSCSKRFSKVDGF